MDEDICLSDRWRPTFGLIERLTDPNSRAIVCLAVLLGFFLTLQVFLPLSTAVKIGADEDYELSKATLCLHGYRLYTEIWNDQPPLDTFIITETLKHISLSVLAPRLLTVGFSVLLLISTFTLLRKVSGLLTAVVGTAALLASPGFVELSCSCMQEIPALAPAIFALTLLCLRTKDERSWKDISAGVIFGFALQMKLLEAMYLPMAAFIIWARYRDATRVLSRTIWSLALVGVCAGASFVGLNYLTGNSLILQLHQSWAAHFASTRSFEYGSPLDRPYDWYVLLKNWDTSVPAVIGLIVILKKYRANLKALLPALWLAWTLLVFSTHKPWWAYYYIHNALPLCWCAGVGVSKVCKYLNSKKNPSFTVASAAAGLVAVCWMGTRVSLAEISVRNSPRLYSCLVLKELERFKPYTTFLFSDQPIFSFHSQIPLPPHLAVISLKRLWSGMSNSDIVAELEAAKPGLILLANNGLEVPYQTFLGREYQLVYRDRENLLYAHQSIAKKPGFSF